MSTSLCWAGDNLPVAVDESELMRQQARVERRKEEELQLMKLELDRLKLELETRKIQQEVQATGGGTGMALKAGQPLPVHLKGVICTNQVKKAFLDINGRTVLVSQGDRINGYVLKEVGTGEVILIDDKGQEQRVSL